MLFLEQSTTLLLVKVVLAAMGLMDLLEGLLLVFLEVLLLQHLEEKEDFNILRDFKEEMEV